MNTPSYADSIWNPITEIDDLYEGVVHNDEYDLLVFIGRCQPLHLGHQRVIDIALQKAKRVLVLVGSAWRARRPRNPWTFEERRDMIRAAYPQVPESKLLIQPMGDFTYRDEVWIQEVQNAVRAHTTRKQKKIGLIGCSKDSSSYYLKLFPQWGDVKVRFLNPLNATDIRNSVFENPTEECIWSNLNNSTVLNPAVSSWISANLTPQFLDVIDYHKACQEVKLNRQAGQRFPVQELCADALVTQSGHVLLQQRGGKIGYGLWGLPGGYVNEDERPIDAALRELREEVKLKVPQPVLRGSLAGDFDADDPHRSERGRVFSKVFHFKLADQTSLPDVRPGNLVEDGRKEVLDVKWVPLAELDSETMFEDHFDLVSKMLGL